MREIVAADIGGTHARFARAALDAEGRIVVDEVRRYRTDRFSSLEECWHAFLSDSGRDAPRNLSAAVAGIIRDGHVRLTNSTWSVEQAGLADRLGLAEVNLVNDFEAVAHAVSQLPLSQLPLLFGPDAPLPENGTVTVLGPGTGLGVALVSLQRGQARILPTEGGHVSFAPFDETDCRILQLLQREFGRVSAERIVSGPGLNHLWRALRSLAGEPAMSMKDDALWQSALEASEPYARRALERLTAAYGTVAGDLALAHGPHHVVLAGGLTARMRNFLVESSTFHARFTAKGRYEPLMRRIPVRFADHPEIGLFGAAASWFSGNS